MSIGRITGAVFTPTIDATVALASLNFDFSLVKLEAPPEYQGFGKALSRQRREVAEAGSTHITARKLGALFANEVPDTPKLLEAYGRRVSEIAGTGTINPQGLRQHGVFADYIGADGTSIWAAATSGRNAISVHLLACMLARIWSASEAISIWVELVAERKKQIIPKDLAEPLSYPDLLASQIQISRDQLAEWDNSARAWLQRADEAKKMEQTQTRLILDNLYACVNSMPTTYASVIEAWKSALVGLDNLLKGISQNLLNGGLLLALLSWQLFPDMLVYGETLISQHDDLFPATARLTVGLEASPAHKDKGIYWSLSLAHMKYYGDPIRAEGNVGDAFTRLTLVEFNHVILGSLFSSWGSEGHNTVNAAKMIIAMRDLVKGWMIPPWLNIFADTAERLLSSKDLEHRIFMRLIALGRTKGTKLLCDPLSHPQPMFGLTDFGNFIRLLKFDQDKIDVLRKYTTIFFPDIDYREVIIRYRFRVPDLTESICEPSEFLKKQATHIQNKSKESNDERDNANDKYDKSVSNSGIQNMRSQTVQISVESPDVMLNGTVSEYATAMPLPRQCISSDSFSKCHNNIHHRWIRDGLDSTKRPQSVARTIESETKQSREMINLNKMNSQFSISAEAFTLWLNDSNETLCGYDEHPPNTAAQTYKLFLGDPNSAALFAISRHCDEYEGELKAPIWSRRKKFYKKVIQYDDIISAMMRQQIDPQSLLRHLQDLSAPETIFAVSLRAVEYINMLYKSMNSATINLKATSQTLGNMQWAKSLNPSKKQARNRERSFACIAAMDTGTIDFHPLKFKNVMALSSMDSLYIAAPLMRDPLARSSSGDILHMIGNVGRHGLLLLVPPAVPQTSIPELDSWKEIEHISFNGKIEDTFTGTSLHLSFTDWSTPIDLGRGQHEAQAYMVESLVSVHDNGRWIADLDVLESLKKGDKQYDHEFFFRTHCLHDHSESTNAEADKDFFDLVCIRTWDEFLERPASPSVVMTHNNWLARLAIATLGVRRGDRVFVRNDVCTQCLKEVKEFDPDLMARALLLV